MSTPVHAASFRSSKVNSRQSSHAVRRTTTTDSSLSSSRLCHLQRIDDVIHLSPQRKEEMVELMQDMERQVVRSMMGSHESLTLWKPHMRKKGIDYYVDEKVGKGLTRFCCVGQTNVPVPNIMEMFMVTNTETLLKNMRIMYRNVKEAKILSVLKPATRSNPYRSVYIRYASFDTPTLMNARDICVCVCTNLIKKMDGSTVGYCLWNSVDIPECPDRFDTDKIVRSRMLNSGFFLRNSGEANAMTRVCYLIGAEIKGVVPQLTGRIYMAIFGGICHRVCQHYRRRFRNPENFKHHSKWTPKNEVFQCYVCGRAFYPLMKKYHCVKCGEVICGRERCFFMEEVSVRGAGITRVRICQICLEEAKMLAWHLGAIGTCDILNSDGSGVRDLLGVDSVSISSNRSDLT
ncbi:hypothetical protein F444_18681 [Phytophthora nicotianae P1976]|uniref:FYVE-type domain-containing protein n=1 Tax=Phytophthora nicotianae P1976 TaxID=1317066 RepID=A0A080ZAL0_PHYNI|nr:hypothetical protein F444_18681 [Phytophthora nicotianae P1976]